MAKITLQLEEFYEHPVLLELAAINQKNFLEKARELGMSTRYEMEEFIHSASAEGEVGNCVRLYVNSAEEKKPQAIEVAEGDDEETAIRWLGQCDVFIDVAAQ